MNKKLILAGAAAIVGFISLTAFDGKTLEQQKAEVAQMVTSKLDEYRMQLVSDCDARVEAEAQTRYAAVVAAREAEMAAKPGNKSTKKTAKGGSAKPLPPAKAPGKSAEDAAKGRMQGQSGKADDEAAKSRMQGQPAVQEEKKAKSRMGGGGGGK